MSPEIAKQIADLMSSAQSAGKDAITFLQQQLPDLCNEIVKWQLAKNTIGLIVCILIFITFLILFIRGVKKNNDDLYLPGAFLSLLSLCLGIIFLVNTVQCIVAPKLVLLEQLKQIIGK